jgi:hypothetical protein
MATTEPADMPEPAETDSTPEAIKPETPAVTEEAPVRENTGSTGTAVQPEVANTTSDHPDIQGNVSEAPNARKTSIIVEKAAQAMKATQPRKKKQAKNVHRRKQAVARQPEPRDPWLNNGYPLYLTVPIPGS